MQKKNDNLIDSLNYNIVSIQINKKRKIARCKSFGFNCEQCNVKCLVNKNNPLTIEDLVKARNQARAAAKNVATQVAENKLQEKEQLKAQLAAEKAKREAEEKAKREAEEKAKLEAVEKAKREAEEKAKREAEEKAKLEAVEKAKREAEEKAKREAEEKAKREAEEKAKREAEEKAKREAEEKAKREAEEKAKREAEEKAKREAEEKAKREAEEKAKREAEEKAKREAEEKAKREAEEKAKREAEEKAKREAEEKAKREAEEKAKREAEEKAAAEKAAAEKAAAEKAQEETAAEEQPAEPAPEQEKGFKLTLPAYMDEVLPRMATKRARKLIYTPKEVVFETSCKIETAGKKNDESIKIKNILDAEIKEGLKLGYLEKYDGLKTSEIKEEYENDTVYEIAEQEFKKSGLLADGDKVKLFIYDWTGGGIHHVGYLPDDKAAEVMPFLNDMDKYSFDICSIITGGKSKTIKKDPETGKFTITKNKDGDYGIELDITIINRKD